MRLLEMVDLADMLRRMGELEADPLAMPAGRKPAALDHRDLVRHVGMRGIMRNRVDAGLRDDLSGLEFLRHSWPPLQTYRRFAKRSSTRPGSRFNGFRRSRPAVAALRAAGYGAVWHGQKSWQGVATLAPGGRPGAPPRWLPRHAPPTRPSLIL